MTLKLLAYPILLSSLLLVGCGGNEEPPAEENANALVEKALDTEPSAQQSTQTPLDTTSKVKIEGAGEEAPQAPKAESPQSEVNAPTITTPKPTPMVEAPKISVAESAKKPERKPLIAPKATKPIAHMPTVEVKKPIIAMPTPAPKPSIETPKKPVVTPKPKPTPKPPIATPKKPKPALKPPVATPTKPKKPIAYMPTVEVKKPIVVTSKPKPVAVAPKPKPAVQKPQTPEEIIQKTLGSGKTLKQFIYTPSKKSALVLVQKEKSTALFLYSLSNPAAPQKEYAVFRGGSHDVIKDITLTQEDFVKFTHLNDTKPNEKHLVVYDYKNKKNISNDYLGIADIDAKTLQNLIQADLPKQRVLKVIVTPSKLGALVKTEDATKTYIHVYGLEVSQHPKREIMIVESDKHDAGLVDMQVYPAGLMSYTLEEKGIGSTHVTYDYFNKKLLNETKTVIKHDEVSLKGAENRINQKLKAHYASQEKWKKENYTPVKIEVKAKLMDDLYLVTMTTSFFDTTVTTGVWDMRKNIDYNHITKTFKKTLTHIHYGPGGEVAEDITIDRNNHRVNYKVKLSQGTGIGKEKGMSEEEIAMYVTGKESRYYDYINNTITKGILPLKLHLADRAGYSAIAPFYAPDKEHAFALSSAGNYTENGNAITRYSLDMYDKQGAFIKRLYTTKMPSDNDTVYMEQFRFIDKMKISFKEIRHAYARQHKYRPEREREVVLNYISGEIVSTSKDTFSIKEMDVLFTDNKHKIVKIDKNKYTEPYLDEVVALDSSGAFISVLFQASKQKHTRTSLSDLRLVNEHTISFLQETKEFKNKIKSLTKILLNTTSGAIISRTKIYENKPF